MRSMQSSAPDDGRKHRPKHIELTWNNKLIYTIVHLVGYLRNCITMHGFMNVKAAESLVRSIPCIKLYYRANQQTLRCLR